MNDLTFKPDDEPITSKKIQFEMVKDVSNNEDIKMEAFLDMDIKMKTPNLKYETDGSEREIPVVLNVQTHEPGFLQGHLPRVPVDLICVIDKSGSMLFEEKMIQLKKTLSNLLKFLLPNDRLCLIQYDSKAKRLTNLRCATPENIEYFEKVIGSIEPSGGTSIVDGLLVAKRVIEQRRDKNKVCSVFLLSDGEDPQGAQSMEKVIKVYDEQFNGEVSINSFGFGDECDEDLLSTIADQCGGLFYYVDDDEDLDEMFIDCLGRIVSVLGQRARLEVKLQVTKAFPEIRFTKTYGDHWTGDSEISRVIDIGYIIAGSTKSFVFKVSLPFNKNYDYDEQESITFVEARLTAESFLSNEKGIIPFKCQTGGSFTLVSKDIDEQPNEDVEIEVMRVEAAEAQSIMYNMISNKQQEEAQKLHSEWMKKILKQGKKNYSRNHPIYKDCVVRMNKMSEFIAITEKRKMKRQKRKMFHQIRSQFNKESASSCYRNSTQKAFMHQIRGYRMRNNYNEEE